MTIVRGEIHIRFDDGMVFLALQQGPIGRSRGHTFARVYDGPTCVAGEDGDDLVDAVRKTLASDRAMTDTIQEHGRTVLAMFDQGAPAQ